MKKLITIIFLSALLPYLSKSQTVTDTLEYKFGIGVNAGMENGFGFATKFKVKDKFFAQVTVMPPLFINETQKNENDESFIFFFDSGLSFYYNLYESKTIRDYIYLGTSYIYLGSKYDKETKYFNGGAGIGLEYKIDMMGFNFSVGQYYSKVYLKKESEDFGPLSSDSYYKGNISLNASIIFYIK